MEDPASAEEKAARYAQARLEKDKKQATCDHTQWVARIKVAGPNAKFPNRAFEVCSNCDKFLTFCGIPVPSNGENHAPRPPTNTTSPYFPSAPSVGTPQHPPPPGFPQRPDVAHGPAMHEEIHLIHQKINWIISQMPQHSQHSQPTIRPDLPIYPTY